VPLTETAYAKINLALHVRKRREDGYHELETLFAFVDDGDRLEANSSPERGGGPPRTRSGVVEGHAGRCAKVEHSATSPVPLHHPADGPPARSGEECDTLSLHGEFEGALSEGGDNIVLAALASLPHATPWTVHLDKRLPVAAGLGGGSADAGAVFRLVERTAGLPDNWQQIAAQLGADVPACVASRTVLGHGTGTQLTPGPDDLAGCPILLVNPRLPLSTGPVFKAWDGHDRGPLPTGTAREIALNGRNDLEAPAITLCPAIADVLATLRNTAPWLTRMSGSGATCFALYDTPAQRAAAAAHIAARHPDWWQMPGALR
jgi:4-diphosphocytidyl-2-C-methyl-D-erythritol kinase